MSPPSRSRPDQSRAWGWVAHLRHGGTTPWLPWTGSGEPAGRVVPGAQQLELLRRLNEQGRPSPGLAARVLEATTLGRGLPDLPLVGAEPGSPYGAAPVDPSALRPGELLRVATVLLAEDLVADPVPTRPPAPWVRPWRTRYRLAGDPELVEPVRAALTARGRPPGGPRPVVLVLGAGLERMLGDVWISRCFAGPTRRWEDWLAGWERRTAVPPRIRLPVVAGDWVGRVGRSRVHVVMDPSVLSSLVRAPVAARAEPVCAHGAELARRLAPAVAPLVPGPARYRVLREVLRPRLVGLGGPPPATPPDRLDWVRREAHRMQEELRGGGYAVHGGPDLVGRPNPVTGQLPTASGALELAVQLLLGVRGGSPGEEQG